MDPSKRICLKNIPPDCTKREIADFVRTRTGAQPHSIDLGLDRDGHIRRYAHFSVEGAKNVIAVLSGAVWRDVELTALPAKPHYTYRLAEARRQRERSEAEEQVEREKMWSEYTSRWMAKTGGELRSGKKVRSFYATRRRYGEVAAEIAKKFREQHYKNRGMYSPREERGKYQYQQESKNDNENENMEEIKGAVDTSAGTLRTRLRGQVGERTSLHYKHPRGEGGASARREKRTKTEATAAPASASAPAPLEPAVPSKEERKLSGLQAKLAALRAKMK